MKREEIFEIVAKNANGTVLSFPERGPWGDSKYRGNFSGFIPASLIYRYNAESVSEIFAGSGTTSDLCKDLGIAYCGLDLNPNPVRKDIVSGNILADDLELPDMFYQADLQMLHPPYPSIQHIKYANGMWKDTCNLATSDIQNMDWEDGMKAVNKAILKGYTAMPKGSYQAVVVGDIRSKGKFRSMLAELVIPGEMEQVLVKLQHNTVSERNMYATQSKRGFFLIEHEFVVVIKKPSGYEIAYILPKQYKSDIRDSITTATWKDVVMAVLRELKEESSLESIYKEIDGHKKCQSNPHWKDKVRQTLQILERNGMAASTQRGRWMAA